MILYLLPFTDEKHFKYGYTETQRQGYARIKKHNAKYGIDLEKAKIVIALDAKTIIDLEKQIKSDYSRFFKTKEFEGEDGFSEILPMEYLEPIIKEIKLKAESKQWLGLKISNISIKSQYEKSRAFVHRLKLRTIKQWRQFCKTGKKPKDIPACPDKTYKNKGWKGWGDWLGTEIIANRLRTYKTFEEAQLFAHSLKLKNQKEWFDYCKSKKLPKDIPNNPCTVYKKKGWKSWGDWLSTKNIHGRFRIYRSFNAAREFVISLQLKSGSQWKAYCKSGQKPDDIPTTPDRVYKGKGWAGMGDWLGTGTVAPQLKVFRDFFAARDFVRSLKLKGEPDWRNYYRSGLKPKDIPTSPNLFYKNKGWENWGDWLGSKAFEHLYKKRYRSFEEARAFVHTLKLRSGKEWTVYCKSGNKPKDIPIHPERAYRDNWKDRGDWLGTGRLAPGKKIFLLFSEARSFVQSLNLKDVRE